LSTGEDLGIVAILGQTSQGFLHSGWCIVFERSWLHNLYLLNLDIRYWILDNPQSLISRQALEPKRGRFTLTSFPQLIGKLYMAQVESSVVNDVQDAPAHRDFPTYYLSHTIQVGLAQSRQHLPCLHPSLFQKTDKLRGISGLGGKLGVTVPGGRAAPHHLSDPEMLCASDMGGQNSQGVGGVALVTPPSPPYEGGSVVANDGGDDHPPSPPYEGGSTDGTPVQGFGGQASDQVTHLTAQILEALPIVVQF
jgi:hypothetical protein